MNETGSVTARRNYAFSVFALADVDIERICREYSENPHQPQVFVVACKSIGNVLLGVNLEFLEEGQRLPCPGLPLVGAVFDPNWGFAQGVIGSRRDGSADFRLPPDDLYSYDS